MNATPSTRTFWRRLEERHPESPQWREAVRGMRLRHAHKPADGPELVSLNGDLLEQALDLAAAEVEASVAHGAFQEASKNRREQRDLLELELVERGIIEASEWALDLRTMCIRAAEAPSRRSRITERSRHTKETSLQATIGGFHSLLSQALSSPLAAFKMGRDPALPEWFRHFCAAITKVDPDDTTRCFAPTLRTTVESWLDDSETAAGWIGSGASYDAPEFLRHIAMVLALPAKATRNAEN